MNLEQIKQYKIFLEKYQYEPFDFFRDVLKLKPCLCIPDLREKYFNLPDGRSIILFDNNGLPCNDDYSLYTKLVSKGIKIFQDWEDGMLTWHQMLKIQAYRDALKTFNTDFTTTFKKRWITTRAGRGTGKSSSTSMISWHFLLCFPGSQTVFITNTEDQIKRVYMKEMHIWFKKLPEFIQDNISFLEREIKINGDRDWFIRTNVSSPEKPESLSGFHGDYVMVLFDEASSIPQVTFDTMRGTLTGGNYVTFFDGNPTRTDGEFFDSHKAKNSHIYTQLHFNSRYSPIVTKASIIFLEEKEGKGSDKVRITIDGEFPGEGDTDDKGWIPLFSGIKINYEKDIGQTVIKPLLGLDPAGSGKNRSVLTSRDNVYLKEEFSEETSSPKSLARRVEMYLQKYNIPYHNLEVDAFGVGAMVINEMTTTGNDRPKAFLGTEQLNENDKKVFNTIKMKRAWELRQWLANGGTIITNDKEGWEKEFNKIKYKQTLKGKMELMGKIEFKKDYGFSPDKFDSALYTFNGGEYNTQESNDRVYAPTEDEWYHKNNFSNPQEENKKRFTFKLNVIR